MGRMNVSTLGSVSMEKPLLSEGQKLRNHNDVDGEIFKSVLDKCINADTKCEKPKQQGLSMDYLCSLANYRN